MVKVWLIISIISLVIGVSLYFDQELRLKASWNWEQFLHHESFIVIFGVLAIAMLTVAFFDNRKL